MKIVCISFIFLLLTVGTSPCQILPIVIRDGFDADIKLMSYIISQEPADNPQNPENTVFHTPCCQLVVELRPDVSLAIKNLAISIKPRLNYQWKRWKIGGLYVKSADDIDLVVNEWLARIQINDRFFVSYGRENLQWGSGWLASPSNPFFSDNDRANPEMEIHGMDFARLVFLPNTTWTFSLISNLDKGSRQLNPDENFERINALKIDFVGNQTYAGLIFANHDLDKTFIGAFGGWTASDALLFYTDLNIYDNLGDHRSSQYGFLLGASYTMESGLTYTLEYAYQKDNDPEFKGHNMIMLQYHDNDILDVLNIVFGISGNFDDNSLQFYGNAEYVGGDNSRLFINTIVNSGGAGKQFGAFLDFQIMVGVKFFF